MARKTVEIFSGYNLGLVHDIDEKPNRINFQLHNHDDLYEVVLLLNGDCEFHVKGNIYCLHPHDIIFTRPTELHKMVCLSEKIYDRIILYIKKDYIKEKKCDQFLNIFENRELGTGNLIVSDITSPSLEDCLSRLLAYSNEGEYYVMDNVIIELLYLLNQSKNTSNNFYIKDENVRNIILYINANLDRELNLETLAKTCFYRAYVNQFGKAPRDTKQRS